MFDLISAAFNLINDWIGLDVIFIVAVLGLVGSNVGIRRQ
jgi:hypothetical protein